MKAVLGIQSTRSIRLGFTLVELLVTLAVIGVLAGLLIPALGRSRRQASRAGCLNHLRQLAIASLSYAADDKDESLSGKTESEDQDLNWLHQGYMDSPRVFVCPATRNTVRTNTAASAFTGAWGLADLQQWAGGVGPSPGCSYQGFGFYGVDVPTYMDILVNDKPRRLNGGRKTLKNIHTYVKYHDAFGLKGAVAGPSRSWIMADWEHAGSWYYPDAGDNHGPEGGNVGYCDGHAAWVPVREYLFQYELSQDEGRIGIPLTF